MLKVNPDLETNNDIEDILSFGSDHSEGLVWISELDKLLSIGLTLETGVKHAESILGSSAGTVQFYWHRRARGGKVRELDVDLKIDALPSTEGSSEIMRKTYKIFDSVKGLGTLPRVGSQPQSRDASDEGSHFYSECKLSP